MKTKPMTVILSCEHAVNTIPDPYQSYFAKHQDLVNSHRGIDFGAGSIANHLHQILGLPLLSATVSRILIDLNRTLHETGCFSKEVSDLFTKEQKQKIIDSYYTPYRRQLTEQVRSLVAKGFQVVHFSIHSFTPVINGEKRNGDIGLLYDPQRASEKKMVYRLQRALKTQGQGIHCRLNYPYKGIADGFTTTLRTQFSDADYLGIEIESNQALTQNANGLARLNQLYVEAFKRLRIG